MQLTGCLEIGNDSMKIIDLTRQMHDTLFVDIPKTEVTEVLLQSADITYTGVVYDFSYNSMAGTYIDFPGHIKECDDGNNAGNYPVEKLYRQTADVIQLDRISNSGGVTANELKTALQSPQVGNKTLIINALGKLDSGSIERRSVFLNTSAVEWIIEQGYEILISDIYESKNIAGVFYKLFQAGIITVCEPVNLYKLKNQKVKISIFPLRHTGITQLPCRVIAEISD